MQSLGPLHELTLLAGVRGDPQETCVVSDEEDQEEARCGYGAEGVTEKTHLESALQMSPPSGEFGFWKVAAADPRMK